ncbi:MAG: AAA family ATPase [Rhodocyclaceae bacterium]|nr:AAA family ATPase [Rhodocyclaceae bacterium]
MLRRTEGAQFKPLRLKHVLAEHGLSQTDWGHAIRQEGGKGMSPAAASQLLNWSAWPRRTLAETIERQTAEFLRAHGVPESEISTAFEVDSAAASAGNPVAAGIEIPHGHQPDHDEETFMFFRNDRLTREAREHFKVFFDPFQNDVQKEEDVFLSADQRYVREAMWQAANHPGWFIAVVGESGAGKSTLRADLEDRVAAKNLPVILVEPYTTLAEQSEKKGKYMKSGQIADAMLDALVPYETRRANPQDRLKQVHNALINGGRTGQNVLLVFEEAHCLPISTLKHLKRFSEMRDGRKPLVSIILIGQPELAHLLSGTNMELREVVQRCEVVNLMPLDGKVGDYLTLKFRRHGRFVDEFMAPSAVDAIRARLTYTGRGGNRSQAVSMVYPLAVNNLVTKAMNEAARLGAPKVTADIVMGC